MVSEYHYNSLPSASSIRLFTLQPGSGEARIEGNLTIISLSDKTATTRNFKALSYTWANHLDKGNPSYKLEDVSLRYISCCRRSMAVTGNLHDALWQLRERKEVSPLWIDAICINQKDKDEIPYQLKLMSRIYAEASLVIIWLGKDDPTTHEAIQVMEKTGETLLMKTKSNLNSEIIPMTITEQHAIANFLLRSWFCRLWTMQEVLLPINTLSLCGSREVDIVIPAMFASTILRTNRTICKNARPGQVEVSIRRLGAAASVAAWMGCIYPAGGFGERAFLRYHEIDYKLTVPRTYKWLVALEFLVHEARQRECSEAKDRIIAPLAFALHEKFLPDSEEFRGVEIEIQKILSDCQSQSPQELYCRFTHFMISKMGNLDILSRAHGDEDTDLKLKLPSWVPPFHTAGSTSLIDELLVTQYDAAKHLGKRSEGPSTKLPELRVRAMFFGEIYKMSKYVAVADTTPSWFSTVLNSPEYQADVETGNNSDIAYTISQALGQRRISQERESEISALRKRREALIFELSSILQMQLNTQVSKGTRRRLFWYNLMLQRQIGLAPALAQEHDCICLLQGARVPFVVRKTEQRGEFRLVGEAFVENFMDGWLQNYNFSEREIVLI